MAAGCLAFDAPGERGRWRKAEKAAWREVPPGGGRPLPITGFMPEGVCRWFVPDIV